MNFQDKNSNEEMSMEDILSSIRKYVSEEDNSKKPQPSASQQPYEKETVINLEKSDVVDDNFKEAPLEQEEDHTSLQTYNESSDLIENVYSTKKKAGPFDKLTEALNSYGRDKTKTEKKNGSLTVDQLFRTIAEQLIKEWLNKNLDTIVEEMVLREIEKIKSE
jgi:cell pole-organizing protein PopZ